MVRVEAPCHHELVGEAELAELPPGTNLRAVNQIDGHAPRTADAHVGFPILLVVLPGHFHQCSTSLVASALKALSGGPATSATAMIVPPAPSATARGTRFDLPGAHKSGFVSESIETRFIGGLECGVGRLDRAGTAAPEARGQPIQERLPAGVEHRERAFREPAVDENEPDLVAFRGEFPSHECAPDRSARRVGSYGLWRKPWSRARADCSTILDRRKRSSPRFSNALQYASAQSSRSCRVIRIRTPKRCAPRGR